MRIIIADGHPLYREGLAHHITRFWPQADIQEATNLEHVLLLIREHSPDLLILDFYLPGMSLEAMAGLASECRSLRILVVSRGSLEPKLEKLIPAGARGFLSKTATADQVESTVHSLLETRFDAPYKVILHSPEERTTVENLSPREAEVLEAVAKR